MLKTSVNPSHPETKVLTFDSVDQLLKCDHLNESDEHYFPAVHLMFYKVVLTFELVNEILKCDHSNESHEQYFPAVYFILYKLVLTFVECVDEII